MTVRAKFRCMDVTKTYSHTDGQGVDYFTHSVRLLPVIYGKKNLGCEENKAFYAATPSGEIVMQMVSEATAENFKPGKAYYVDFEEAAE